MERETEEERSEVHQEKLKEEKTNAKNLPFEVFQKSVNGPIAIQGSSSPTWGGGGIMRKGRKEEEKERER